MQIKKLPGWALVAAVFLAATELPAMAGEDSPPAAVPEAEEQPLVASDGEADEVEAADDSVGGQMGEVSLDRFVPTEEISADGAVSFPVDI